METEYKKSVIILKVLNKIKYGLENITGKTAMDT